MLKVALIILLVALFLLGNGWWGFRRGVKDTAPADYPAAAVGNLVLAIFAGLVMAGVMRFLAGWEPNTLPIVFGGWFLVVLTEGIGQLLGWWHRDTTRKKMLPSSGPIA